MYGVSLLKIYKIVSNGIHAVDTFKASPGLLTTFSQFLHIISLVISTLKIKVTKAKFTKVLMVSRFTLIGLALDNLITIY